MCLTLNPYLSFSGTCAEAFAFYKECFGGGKVYALAGDHIGQAFGMLAHRYGVSWMITCEAPAS